MMFPPEQLNLIIQLTNKNLRKQGQRETTKGEIVCFFGIIILGTKFEFGSRRDLWATRSKSRLVDPPRFGEKTGMGRHRFDNLWSAIRYSDQPDERGPDEDSSLYCWKLVDDFVTNFNSHRAGIYSPSDSICVDESISRWYGLGGTWINIGLPNYVAIDRKPDNGCEIQDACDGRSKVMIRLRLVKGAELDNVALEEHADANGLHGTMVLKDLVSPWFHSGQLVVGDSYFASVPATLAMQSVGLRFIGPVKTATRQFPLNYLSTVELPKRGDYHGVINTDTETGCKLMAFVWVDRERWYFISNCSSLSPGLQYSPKRWREV